MDQLGDIVVACRRNQDCAGLFAAMYRAVSSQVRQAVREGGLFADDASLEAFAVRFADRYLDAYRTYRRGGTCTRSWQLAFDYGASRRRRMIIQHLWVGMNAHINLDLGIATVEAAPPGRLPVVYGDYLKVNEILFQMVDRLQSGLSEVSPRMAWLDRLGLGWDESIMRLALRTARDVAWGFADALSEVEGEDRERRVADRDEDAAALARLIAWRWSPVHLAGVSVAAAERRSLSDAIDAFDTLTLDLDMRCDGRLTWRRPHRIPDRRRLVDVAGSPRRSR